jgi:hypothetical protein
MSNVFYFAHWAGDCDSTRQAFLDQEADHLQLAREDRRSGVTSGPNRATSTGNLNATASSGEGVSETTVRGATFVEPQNHSCRRPRSCGRTHYEVGRGRCYGVCPVTQASCGCRAVMPE